MMKTMAKSSQEDNNIFEPRESKCQTPTTNLSEKKPRPTAWPTKQQIWSQNPYRKMSNERSPTCKKRSPPSRKEPMDQLESPRLGKNPKYNPNYSQDHTNQSPTQTKTRITHNHMFEDIDTPSLESFRTNATITSTPKVSRKELKDERQPRPNMITRNFR